MGLFKKKQHRTADDSMSSSAYHEEDASSKGTRRSVSKWICGSSSAKKALEEDNRTNILHKVSRVSSHGSYTSTSSGEKRDERQVVPSSPGQRLQASPFDDPDNSLIYAVPPPAAESAFNGPPRFDWIDVEYNAATRVQKIFRRHLVQQEMEQAGLSTSYLRNRKRQRKAKESFFPISDDTDFGYGCCSMGLAFGQKDYDASDNLAFNDYHRQQYEQKKRAQKEREESLSKSYLEQKGIQTKAIELDQTKFREHSFLHRM